jgi:hypothetical protein
MSRNVVKRDRELIQKLRSGTSYDRIYAHYIYPEEIELTKKEKELRERWSFAWTTLLNERVTGEVVEMLVNEYDISIAQAYRDLKIAKKLFGDVNESTKQAERNFLSELALITFREAANARNFNQMNKAITNLIKLKGLDQDEPDNYDEESMKSHNYYMVFNINGEQTKLDVSELDTMSRDNKIKLQQILEHDITDVESVEILKS